MAHTTGPPIQAQLTVSSGVRMPGRSTVPKIKGQNHTTMPEDTTPLGSHPSCMRNPKGIGSVHTKCLPRPPPSGDPTLSQHRGSVTNTDPQTCHSLTAGKGCHKWASKEGSNLGAGPQERGNRTLG